MPHYPTPSEVAEIYAQRDEQIAALEQRPEQITFSDLLPLDRLGRFRVACDLWAKCEESARSALLDDVHAHVRAAAEIAQRDFSPAPEDALRRALLGRDLAGVVKILSDSSLRTAQELCLAVGFGVGVAKTKAEFMRQIQPNLLRACREGKTGFELRTDVSPIFVR